MALGARIKEAREGLKWDQATLCEKVEGLSQQSLSALESRDSKTSDPAAAVRLDLALLDPMPPSWAPVRWMYRQPLEDPRKLN